MTIRLITIANSFSVEQPKQRCIIENYLSWILFTIRSCNLFTIRSCNLWSSNTSNRRRVRMFDICNFNFLKSYRCPHDGCLCLYFIGCNRLNLGEIQKQIENFSRMIWFYFMVNISCLGLWFDLVVFLSFYYKTWLSGWLP